MFKDQDLERDAGVAVHLMVLQVDSVPISQTSIEFRSARLPDNTDWEFVDAYMHARVVVSTPDISLQDDGVNLTAVGVPVAGVQTKFVNSDTPPLRVKGGSEIRLIINTGGAESLEDLTVTARFRPLYTYGHQAHGPVT